MTFLLDHSPEDPPHPPPAFPQESEVMREWGLGKQVQPAWVTFKPDGRLSQNKAKGQPNLSATENPSNTCTWGLLILPAPRQCLS